MNCRLVNQDWDYMLVVCVFLLTSHIYARTIHIGLIIWYLHRRYFVRTSTGTLRAQVTLATHALVHRRDLDEPYLHSFCPPDIHKREWFTASARARTCPLHSVFISANTRRQINARRFQQVGAAQKVNVAGVMNESRREPPFRRSTPPLLRGELSLQPWPMRRWCFVFPFVWLQPPKPWYECVAYVQMWLSEFN